jgi:hemerythrin
MTSKINLAAFPKEYLMNIAELDEQHETYFTMLAKVRDVIPDLYKVLDDDEVDELLDVVGDLRDYAFDHFGIEEAYMKEVDFPGLAAQKAGHNRFISSVIRMEAELMNGTAVPAIKIYNFMNDWFREHILKDDKPFGDFYLRNKK